MSLYVSFRSVVHALSDCLDLVGINDVHHGKRVGIMATTILSHLGWSQEQQDEVFDACLLHDIGVSSSDLHRQLVEAFDWEGARGMQSSEPIYSAIFLHWHISPDRSACTMSTGPPSTSETQKKPELAI